MPKIKYMGSADVANLNKGENIGGRLQGDAILSKDVVFNKDNNFVVDSGEAGMSDEFVSALLEADPDRFKDVTDLKRVPSNNNERLFLGHNKTADAEDVLPGGSEVDPGGTTTAAGGSTAGTTRGGKTTTAGGSTGA